MESRCAIKLLTFYDSMINVLWFND